MKQLLQNLRTGETYLQDTPVPQCPRGHVLVRTTVSAVSPGTERMLVEFAQGNLLQKARSQPERVREVLDKIQADGLLPTLEAVFAKLDEPLPLGYCNVGRVMAHGDPALADVLPLGCRVVSNAPHAEIVAVGRNVVARVPDGASDEEAAFTPLAAISLQGMRLAKPEIGEVFWVMGLGPVGLFAVQLLVANGCRVYASDFNEERLELARQFGATPVNAGNGTDLLAVARAATGGIGVDGVLIAAATESNDPIRQAAAMARHRGRIVLLGVVGLQLDRREFFRKELSFQVSCSYGPGRYDDQYEKDGIDYPPGFVRWTMQRNFEAVLALMVRGQVRATPLIRHRCAIADAPRLYKQLADAQGILGAVLEYGQNSAPEAVPPAPPKAKRSRGTLVIGAGNFARRMILPLLKRQGIRVDAIVSPGGKDAAAAARLYGIPRVETDARSMLQEEWHTVYVLTRHDSHAELAALALERGANVFVEKPLSIDLAGVQRIAAAHTDGEILHVGFNRRFAPLVASMREAIEPRVGPVSISMTINAGALPAGHWSNRSDMGGGRLVGEGCHFIDLARFITQSPIDTIHATGTSERFALAVGFADGSHAAISYTPDGARRFPKEMVVASSQGTTVMMENFRRLSIYTAAGRRNHSTIRQDKGHRNQIAAFHHACRSAGNAPIPRTETVEVALATLAARESLVTGQAQCMEDWRRALAAP